MLPLWNEPLVGQAGAFAHDTAYQSVVALDRVVITGRPVWAVLCGWLFGSAYVVSRTGGTVDAALWCPAEFFDQMVGDSEPAIPEGVFAAVLFDQLGGRLDVWGIVRNDPSVVFGHPER
jgi:hypothetical protein